MPRPRSEDPRTETMRFRVTPGEKARIGERAIAAGMKVPDFLRARALGLRPRGLDRPAPAPRRAPERPTNPRVTPTGLEVAQEVEEAKMDDDHARDAFVARRTLQLVGQGNTRLVARRKAVDEWERRGTAAS